MAAVGWSVGAGNYWRFSWRAANYGAVFFDPSGWHDMCGHSSMGLICYMVRSGLLVPQGEWSEIRLDTPAGLVKLFVNTEGFVKMVNVPSYVLGVVKARSEKLGELDVYVSYGSNYYGVVDLDELGVNWMEFEKPP